MPASTAVSICILVKAPRCSPGTPQGAWWRSSVPVAAWALRRLHPNQVASRARTAPARRTGTIRPTWPDHCCWFRSRGQLRFAFARQELSERRAASPPPRPSPPSRPATFAYKPGQAEAFLDQRRRTVASSRMGGRRWNCSGRCTPPPGAKLPRSLLRCRRAPLRHTATPQTTRLVQRAGY